MLTLALRDRAAPLTLLALGAHCDDIEIGCAGTLRTLADRYPQLTQHWVTFTSEPTREPESRAAAERLFAGEQRPRLHFEAFRASYFPDQWGRIKDSFEALRERVKPDLVLTHHLADRHQDHRIIAELTWNTFRDHLILEYEIPKYEGDRGQPNCYVPLSRDTVALKVTTLLECFPTQRARSWFTEDTFRAHLRLRGIECNAPDGFAEAFHARKLVI